ncbi:MAG: hypothetical protein JOY71_01460 [Acetobacteraceae bacterium]|nr:hypothetical protein [Acetobacteraceae bacterium]
MRVWAGMVAILMAGTALPAAAADGGFNVRTAGDLAALCAGEPGGPRRAAAENFCDGFAQGVVSLELRHEKRAFCIPNPSPSRQQTMREFVTWARANPSRLDAPSTEGLLQFFRERFPCSKG